MESMIIELAKSLGVEAPSVIINTTSSGNTYGTFYPRLPGGRGPTIVHYMKVIKLKGRDIPNHVAHEFAHYYLWLSGKDFKAHGVEHEALTNKLEKVLRRS